MDMGVAQSDWQYHACNGTSKFEDNKGDKLRAVFSVHGEPFNVVLRARQRHRELRRPEGQAGERQPDLDAFARRELPDGLAWQSGAEAIVMAPTPHDELRGMLVGSCAGKVVRNAGIPVMVVR